MKATDVLEKAAKHMRDRAATYDKPEGERSMAKTVAAFNAITGKSLSVAEGWLFMAVLKQVRVFQNPAKPHQDSLEDGVAYAALLAEEMLTAEPVPSYPVIDGYVIGDECESEDGVLRVTGIPAFREHTTQWLDTNPDGTPLKCGHEAKARLADAQCIGCANRE